MEAILQANDQIDAVYTHDDDMAEGVVAAIENAGREDEMILTGAGGSCTAFDRIEAGGLYAATYLYSPSMAGSAVNMARLIALGDGFSDLVEPDRRDFRGEERFAQAAMLSRTPMSSRYSSERFFIVRLEINRTGPMPRVISRFRNML